MDRYLQPEIGQAPAFQGIARDAQGDKASERANAVRTDPGDPGNWQLVRWPVSKVGDLHFEPSVCRLTGRAEGICLWVAQPGNALIGVRFSWFQMSPGYVLLGDMTALSSNLVLTDNRRVAMDSPSTSLATLICGLPWQPHAVRALQRERRLGKYLGDVVLPPPQPLTTRESECLTWLAAGKRVVDIAVILSISESTVSKHVESAKRKLGCETREQAVLRAFRTVWL